jgi:AraC family transcriptional activator of pobA
LFQSSPRRPRPEANPHRATLVATEFEAALAERAWSAASLDGAPCFRAFFVRRGRAVFKPRDGAALELVAPQILWLPFAARGEFRLAAGGDGAALLASEDIVWRTIGENPLAAQLRPLLDRILVAAAGLAEIDMLFAALARESREPGPGAPVMAGLYLGLLLMHLWREGGLARASDALAAGAPTAQRFRQLVELRYRDNLGLDDYARMLGVARAHLHEACARAFGRPPQRLVHERLIAEARVRLRDTGQTAEQIAYGLGFRDPAYFSRFFSRRVGMSPGAYRKAARLAPPPPPTAFAAWP